MDNLDFLSGDAPVVDDVQLEPVEPVAAPEGVTEPAEVAPQPSPAPEPEAKPAIPEGYVPLGVVLDTRDKLKAEQQARERAEEQLRQFQQPAPTPDDPEAFQRHQFDQVQAAVMSTRLDVSEDMAREKHGDAIVDGAKDWALAKFASNPAFQQEVLAQRNPYGYAVQQYQREQALGKLGDPSQVEQFLAWKAAQGGDPTTAAPAIPAIETPAIPSRSLASAPSAGGTKGSVEPISPDAAYGSIFGET